MLLLKKFISNDLSDLHKNNVRIKVIGSKIGIPKDILKLIKGAEELTLNNSGLYLQIAFNYSGRDEIVNTTRRIAIAASKGDVDPRNINKEICKDCEKEYMRDFRTRIPENDLHDHITGRNCD